MSAVKSLSLLFAIVLLTACERKAVSCKSQEDCVNDPNCLCWCSQICKYRKKNPSDHPTYIKNDPYGKFCYCKQWDFDHYEDNCVNHKGVKEPKGAK